MSSSKPSNEIEEIFNSHVKEKGWGWGIFDPSSMQENESITRISSIPRNKYDGAQYVPSNVYIVPPKAGHEYNNPLLNDLRNWVTSLCESINNGIPVHLFLIDSTLFEVHAFISNKHEYIGISYGAINILKLIFNKILADGELLPHIGDPQKEASNITVWHEDYRHIVRDHKVFVPSFPLNYTRSVYADYLSRVALKFLVSHEFAHISSGHLGFLKEQNNQKTPTVTDNIFELSKSETNIRNHMLELDADSLAYVLYGVSTVQRRKSLRSYYLEKDYFGVDRSVTEAIFGSNTNLIKTFCFAVFLLFHFLDYDSQKRLERERNLFEYTHPPFSVRARSLRAYMSFHFSKMGLPAKDKLLLERTATEALYDASKSFSRIIANDKPWESISFEKGSDHILHAYMGKITEMAAKIGPSLDKHRRLRY